MALAETARLIASLELRDKFSGALRNAEGALGSFEKRTSMFSRIGTHAGRGLSNASRNIQRIGLYAGAAAVGGLAAATRAAIDFEDAFAGVRKTVDEAELIAAGSSFDELAEDIRAMAREMPVAATELAVIGEAAGALGVKATDLDEFIRVVAQLGVTTNLTTEQASTALGQLGTILDLTGQDYEDFADTLVGLGNAGASTEDQIVEMAARFAAAGKSAGLTNDDILALSSAVSSMGIDVEAGGSALSRVFNNVATNIGTSSTKAEAFADALGLSAGEFKDAWERDALGTFEDFLGKLATLDQFQAADLLKKVGITNTRDVNTVRLMSQNIEDVNAALETSRTSTGALGTEAAEKFKTTASQIQILKNNLTDVGITIGNEVLPKIVELSGELVRFLNEPKTKAAIKDFAAKIPGAIDELVKVAKEIPWQSIATALQNAAGFAGEVMKAFLAAPDWLKTAIITGWGLNKLTGGALGSIVGELGKGLIKGVLGINAGVVNVRGAVVNGAGGVPGAVPGKGAPGGGPTVLGSLKVMGGLFLAGIAIDQLFQAWGRTTAEIEANSEAVKDLITTTVPNQTYTQSIDALRALIATNDTNSQDILKSILMQTGSGREETVLAFRELAANLQSAAQTPEERAEAARLLEQLRDQIATKFVLTVPEGEALAVELGPLIEQLRNPPPVTLAPATAFTLTEPFGPLRQILSDQITHLDRNHDGVVSMKEALAERLGVTIEQLRGVNTKEQLVAERLGISISELRTLKGYAQTSARGINTTNALLRGIVVNTRIARQRGSTIADRADFRYPGLATGGPANPWESYIVGEGGRPEVLHMGSRRGFVEPTMGSQPISVQVVVSARNIIERTDKYRHVNARPKR